VELVDGEVLSAGEVKIADPQVLLAAGGLILIAILLGTVVITLAGIPFGLTHWHAHFFSLPHPSGTFLKLDLRSATKLGFGELIFVFFFVDLFDNVGTLLAFAGLPAKRETSAREPCNL
jgi:AGZA family xanthine/uracil permease-like MFS transporter